MSAPDQFVREQALDISRSFIVQAPAGSGKTELLIQRYLALLATVDEPEEVLAITFTRKAVAEMRKRVIEALQATQLPQPESAHEALTWQLASDAVARSEQRQWNLLSQPARLHIMTIDSLNASLVKSMPWLSELGADVALDDHPQQLYEEAAWQALDSSQADEQVASALQTLLLHLDNNDRRIVRLLCGLLAKRDQWLDYLVPLRSGRAGDDIRQQLTQMFEQVIEEQLEDLHASIPVDIGQEMVRIAAAGGSQLWSQGNTDKAHVACRELSELPLPTLDQAALWKGLAGLFLTGKGEWRSARSFNRTLGFLPGHEYKAVIEALQEKLQESDKLHIKFKEIRELPEVIFSDAQWAVLAALIELLPVTVAQLKLVFRQHSAMDFVEQSLAARAALGQGDQVTDLEMKLDVRLRHILMDEFQDTSHSQFGLLKQLIAGWQPDDGRSLFLVGDPMQSIYGFREADVSGFLKVRDHGIADIYPESLELSANFRSTPALVDWFNTVFPDVLASEDNLSLGAVRYTGAQSARAPMAESTIRMDGGLDRDREIEAKRVFECIQQAMDADSEQSIGVLVRSRGHLHELYHLLLNSGIDFQAVDILPIATQPVVHDLLSVTRTLLHLHDRIAWLAVLRAPWCGLTLDSLHRLTVNHPQQDLWELINSLDIQQLLDDEERQRLQRVIDCYEAVLNHGDELTLRTRVEWLWRGLGGRDCHIDAEQDMQTYFQVIDKLDQGGQVITPGAILNALQEVYSSNEPDTQSAHQPRVQLMTIHKSKGLQFDTVILPALDRAARSDDKELLVWHEELGDDYELRLLLAPIHAPGGSDASFDFVRKREQRRRAYETQRLLYVAITRAKNHLYLFASLESDKEGNPRSPRAGSFLSLLYHHTESHFLPSVDDSMHELTPDESAPVYLKRVATDWTPSSRGNNVGWQSDDPVLTQHERIEFSWAGQAARIIGTVVHHYLHRIGQQGIDHWDSEKIDRMHSSIEVSLVSEGLPRNVLQGATEKVVKSLINVVSSEKARWLLSAHKHAHSEYAISGVIGGRVVNRIIDRTFIDEEDTLWIIDYKTSAHEGGNLDGFLDEEQKRYEAQLNEYAQIMGSLVSQPQLIRAGLYFPLMDAWREVSTMGAVCLMKQ